MSSQNKKAPNLSFKIETKINAPAEKVWEILGKDFVNIAAWTATVKESSPVTANNIPSEFTPLAHIEFPGRKTYTQNKGRELTAIEVLTIYSDQDRELEFYGVGIPKFMEYVSDKQSVQSLGVNESVVVFDVNMRLKGIAKLLKGFIKSRFQKTFLGIQQELKIYAETGQIARAQ